MDDFAHFCRIGSGISRLFCHFCYRSHPGEVALDCSIENRHFVEVEIEGFLLVGQRRMDVREAKVMMVSGRQTSSVGCRGGSVCSNVVVMVVSTMS